MPDIILIVAAMIVIAAIVATICNDFDNVINELLIAEETHERLFSKIQVILDEHTRLIEYLRSDTMDNCDKYESQKRFKDETFSLLVALGPESKWEVLSPIESSRLSMYPVGGYAIFRDDKRVGIVSEDGNKVSQVLDIYSSSKAL
jgi:hypothetical protein